MSRSNHHINLNTVLVISNNGNTHSQDEDQQDKIHQSMHQVFTQDQHNETDINNIDSTRQSIRRNDRRTTNQMQQQDMNNG